MSSVSGQENDDRCHPAGACRPGGWPSILLQSTHKMLLCCCWPVHKCVTVLSLFDTVIVLIFAYNSLNVTMDSYPEVHWLMVLSLLFFTAFSVCQVLATVLVILGHKKQLSHYLWPRLTLLCGLVICSFVVSIVMLYYFSGGASSMNKFFFSVYEWFFNEQLDDRERHELMSELKLYAGCFTALTMTFCAYSFFELLLTRKFYISLKSFQPVPTVEPTAPQQSAYNPEYQSGHKMYPNLA